MFCVSTQISRCCVTLGWSNFENMLFWSYQKRHELWRGNQVHEASRWNCVLIEPWSPMPPCECLPGGVCLMVWSRFLAEWCGQLCFFFQGWQKDGGFEKLKKSEHVLTKFRFNILSMVNILSHHAYFEKCTFDRLCCPVFEKPNHPWPWRHVLWGSSIAGALTTAHGLSIHPSPKSMVAVKKLLCS